MGVCGFYDCLMLFVIIVGLWDLGYGSLNGVRCVKWLLFGAVRFGISFWGLLGGYVVCCTDFDVCLVGRFDDACWYVVVFRDFFFWVYDV